MYADFIGLGLMFWLPYLMQKPKANQHAENGSYADTKTMSEKGFHQVEAYLYPPNYSIIRAYTATVEMT